MIKYILIILIVVFGLYFLCRKNEYDVESDEAIQDEVYSIETPLDALKNNFAKVNEAIQNQDVEFIEDNAFGLLNRIATTGKDSVEDFLRDRYVNKGFSGLRVENKIPVDDIIPSKKNVAENAVLVRDSQNLVNEAVKQDSLKKKAVMASAKKYQSRNNSVVFDQRFMP